MAKDSIKVRASPVSTFRRVTEDIANPLQILFTVSILSYRALSHGGMKPNFIHNEKGKNKKPPMLKRHREEKNIFFSCN